tara:strand:- start:3 stop:554 length:552 start_codon:yes stop_codon:yes gene_type:complete
MKNTGSPFFIEDKDFLSKGQKKTIDSLVEDRQVPFYLSPVAAVKNDKCVNFGHQVITRADKGAQLPGIENSELVNFTRELLSTFCTKHKIKYKSIYRAAINVTVPNNVVYKVGKHKDHLFPHKQLLIYLNNSYDGDTVILDYKDKEYKVVSPKIYKGVMFGSTNHYHYLPTQGTRVVMIITFI